MSLRICFIFELARQIPAMLGCKFLSLGQHSAALKGSGRENYPGTKETHHFAPLDTEVFGHRNHQRIALLCTHHRQTDAGIAAGSLNNCLPWSKGTRSFGMLNDA